MNKQKSKREIKGGKTVGKKSVPEKTDSTPGRHKTEKAYLVRELSETLVKQTEEFLRNPPDITSYRTLIGFLNMVMKCVIRNDVDPDFAFDTKTASTLAYVATVISVGLSQQQKEGGSNAGMEQQYQALTQQQNMMLTMDQAALVLKQPQISMQLQLIQRFSEQNRKDQEPVTVVVEEIKTPETPVERNLVKIQHYAQKQYEEPANKEIKQNDTDLAF